MSRVIHMGVIYDAIAYLAIYFSAAEGIAGRGRTKTAMDDSRMLLKGRRIQESKVHLDRAVSLAPETRAVYYERGKLNLILGDYQQARRDAEQASKL
jgi:tetratricopeptide (TPR) repeat protein